MTTHFSTCDLCDPFRDLDDGVLRVLPPVFRSFGKVTRFAGPVTTLRCFEDNALLKEAVESPGNGRVLVVDGGGSLRRALIGGNLAAAAAANGWAGVVIDGCVRDVDELATMPIGILALAAHPLRSVKRGIGRRDECVTFAGVSFEPGHWIYADANGLAVSPASLLAG